MHGLAILRDDSQSVYEGNTMLPNTTIAAVYSSFDIASANRTHRNAREDCHQRAWQSLLQRRSTKWRDAKKLDSQATNACRDAIRQEARETHFDQRITLTALQWEALEETQRNNWQPEPEALSDFAKLFLRVKAIKVARTMRVKGPGVRSIATQFAITHQCVPTRHDIEEGMLHDILRDLH